MDEVALPPSPGPCRTREVGSRYLNLDGYVNIKTEEGIFLEHRVVMEEVLGRKLVLGETVHHKNGIRHDNNAENLELWFSPQPYGQRAIELVEYVIENHLDEVLRRLK